MRKITHLIDAQSVESTSGVINVSKTVNPTLVVSVFELALSNNVCLFTFTNCPLM